MRQVKGRGPTLPHLKHVYTTKLRKISEYVAAEKALRDSFYSIPLEFSEVLLDSGMDTYDTLEIQRTST